MTRTEILQHYKNFFDLNELGIGEDDQIHIDWAEALLKDANVVNKNALLAGVSGCFYNHKPTGIKGTLLKKYKPTGKPETIMIDTFDNDVYFAPATEFELINNR